MESFIHSIYGLEIISLIGMFIHFAKKKIKGETFTAMTDYFKDNTKSTIVAFLTTIVATGAYYYSNMGTGGVLDLTTVFGLGYTFDSLLNTWTGGTSSASQTSGS